MQQQEGTTALLNCGKWRLSLKLRDLSEPGGVLISIEKGELLIGNVPGFAMAASEAERWLVPSVEKPEGADIPIERKKLRYG